MHTTVYTTESTDTKPTDNLKPVNDSKIVYYRVLGDIRPILYAIFSILLIFFILASAYIIGKRIKNSRCNEHTSAIRQDGDFYQEINCLEQNVTYSVCRTNIEEIVGISTSVGESDPENNEEKNFGRESTDVKSTDMG
jgi:hypothetical protein